MLEFPVVSAIQGMFKLSKIILGGPLSPKQIVTALTTLTFQDSGGPFSECKIFPAVSETFSAKKTPPDSGNVKVVTFSLGRPPLRIEPIPQNTLTMLTTQENRMPNLCNLTTLTFPEFGGLLSMPRSSRCFSIFGVKVATIGQC